MRIILAGVTIALRFATIIARPSMDSSLVPTAIPSALPSASPSSLPSASPSFMLTSISSQAPSPCTTSFNGTNTKCATTFNGTNIIPSSLPSAAPTTEDFEDCPAIALHQEEYLGDGYCDAVYNVVICAYDGGDCCEESCLDANKSQPADKTFDCGSNFYDCKDPAYLLDDTYDVTFQPSLVPTGQLSNDNATNGTDHMTRQPSLLPTSRISEGSTNRTNHTTRQPSLLPTRHMPEDDSTDTKVTPTPTEVGYYPSDNEVADDHDDKDLFYYYYDDDDDDDDKLFYNYYIYYYYSDDGSADFCIEALLNGDLTYIGDGWCDAAYNMQDCDFDGGDCCEQACEPSTYVCGSNGYDCKDPTFSDDGALFYYYYYNYYYYYSDENDDSGSEEGGMVPSTKPTTEPTTLRSEDDKPLLSSTIKVGAFGILILLVFSILSWLAVGRVRSMCCGSRQASNGSGGSGSSGRGGSDVRSDGREYGIAGKHSRIIHNERIIELGSLGSDSAAEISFSASSNAGNGGNFGRTFGSKTAPTSRKRDGNQYGVVDDDDNAVNPMHRYAAGRYDDDDDSDAHIVHGGESSFGTRPNYQDSEEDRLRALLRRAGLSHFTQAMLDFGVAGIEDLLDNSLVTEHDLHHEIGLSDSDLVVLQKALAQTSHWTP